MEPSSGQGCHINEMKVCAWMWTEETREPEVGESWRTFCGADGSLPGKGWDANMLGCIVLTFRVELYVLRMVLVALRP